MSDARTESDGTSTTTPELATWLLARIAEDEHHARSRASDLGDRLRRQADTVARRYGDPDPPESEIGPADLLWFTAQDCAEHIARHDPARVLAECDAKRRIIERYLATEARADELITDGLGRELDDEVAERLALEWVVRLLALPYADRDGYREEWKPQ